MAELAPFDCAAVYARSKDGGDFQLVAASGDAGFPSSVPCDSRLSVRLAAERCVLCRDNDPSLDERLRALGANAALGASSPSGLEIVALLSARKAPRIQILEAASAAIEPAAIAAEAARMLASRGQPLQEILDAIPIAVIATGPDCKTIFANRTALELLGKSEEELLGPSPSSIPVNLRALLERCLQQGAEVSDEQLNGHGCKTAALTATVRLFRDEKGAPIGGAMILSDASPMEKLRKRIREQERLAWLGTIAAFVAHEIKNPLVSIRTLAQLLPEKFYDSEFRNEFAAVAVAEVDRINDIVERLLDFARPSEPAVEVVDVTKIISETLSLLKAQIAEKNISVSFTSSAAETALIGDANQLKQVFLNLFLNGIQAMAEGGTLSITASNPPAASELTVEVADNGSGISRDQMERIFEPFFSTKRHGSGLGLTITQMIVRQHNGKIEVESEEGKGAIFRVRLPLSSRASDRTAE